MPVSVLGSMLKQPVLLEDLVKNSEEITSIQEAKDIIGNFSMASKLPCPSYSIPAEYCHTGTILRGIEGSVCQDCYACDNEKHTGWFIKDRVMQPMTHRMLQVLFNPRWTKAMIFLLDHYWFEFFRWHESGDILSYHHFEQLCIIADAVPQTKFWLPTQEWNIIIEYWEKHGKIPLKQLHPNLIIRLSARMKNDSCPTWLAERLGVATSNVSSDMEKVDCPAHNHGQTCGDCRNCWKYDKMTVTYALHITGEGDGLEDEFTKKVMEYLEMKLLAGYVTKTDVYREVSQHFSYPEIKVRLLANVLRKRYNREGKIVPLVTNIAKRGRKSTKLKIIQ